MKMVREWLAARLREALAWLLVSCLVACVLAFLGLLSLVLLVRITCLFSDQHPSLGSPDPFVRVEAAERRAEKYGGNP